MKNLATASKKELKAYAFEELALNLTLRMGEDTMIEKILAACKAQGKTAPNNTIETAHGKASGYLTVNIAKQAGPGGGEAVFLGVQGKGILVPRGMNIKIPYPYVVCLENSQQDLFTDDGDGGLNKETVYQYPYQIIDGELKPEHRTQLAA